MSQSDGSPATRRPLGRGPGAAPPGSRPEEGPEPTEVRDAPAEAPVPEPATPSEPEPAPRPPDREAGPPRPRESHEAATPETTPESAPEVAERTRDRGERAGSVDSGDSRGPDEPSGPEGPADSRSAPVEVPGRDAAPEVAAPEVDLTEAATPHEGEGPQGSGEPSGSGVAAPEEAGEPDQGEGGEGQPAPEDGGFRVVLDNFEGPFDLLLQLISKHKLDVTEVALHRVTDEFMAHIRAMGPDWDLDQTTEFLVVAATLLDLKAARLLPTAEVEDEADLALLEARDLLFARLLQYRAYKEIADIFQGRLAQEALRHPRTVGLEPHHAELLPEVVLTLGAEGLARLAVKAMQPRPEPQVYVEHIHAPLVSVREQAEVVVARLRERGQLTFSDLVADTGDTLTVVARFLALLELYREKAVELEQAEALGELTIRWSGAEDLAPTVTDEFDQPPAPPEGVRPPGESAR
ncbi:segregation/condensation protein A [Streptomyces sp. NPDC005438]|uniref:segregation/condensation protein A n=1 Tax=Streptomyces sp. NPDC005438 TaxID=3156880 RepID=UPI0033BE6B69